MPRQKVNIKESIYSKENEDKFADRNVSKYSQALLDLIKEETKKVKGIFRVYGADGNPLDGAWEKVTFRKFPEELVPCFSQHMQDGQSYEVPLYVARFLNGYDGAAKGRNGVINSCAFAIHKWKTTQHGAPVASPMSNQVGSIPIDMSEPDRYKRTYGFESLLIGMDVA